MFPGGESTTAPKVNRNGSERHIEVWNQTAAEMGVPIKWVKDVGQRHQIDVYAQELEIPAEAREKFGLSNSTPPPASAGHRLWLQPLLMSRDS